MRCTGLFIAVAILALPAGAASAQAPAPVCSAPAPIPGQTLHGPVLHVPGADAVCVATGPLPADWVRVPIVRPAPDRNRLMAAVFGQNATCRIDAEGRGECAIDGVSLARRLQQPQVVRTSADWR